MSKAFGKYKGSDVLAIAREYFPGWNDDDLGFIIWNETAYPLNLAHDGIEQDLRQQLAELAEKISPERHERSP